MSYLQSPRLHFFGEFVAEPSTINNRPDNIVGPIVDPGWNPNGSHRFAFTNCRVTALAADGQLTTTGDPLIGAAVTTPGSPAAKIVDLDVEVQLASKIYALNIAIADSAGNSVRGSMVSASFRDFFDARLLGIYQSSLTGLQWQAAPGSWLARLKAASPNALSIRFITDLFTGFSGPHRGRVAGAIGPAIGQEPAHYPAGRRLVGVEGPAALAELSGDTLTLDVGNVVGIQGGQSVHPNLIVGVKPEAPNRNRALKGGAIAFAAAALPSGWRELGTVPTTIERYRVTSGIESLELSPQDAVAVQSSPLGLFTPAGAPVAHEAEDGLFVFPDRWAVAMNPGEQTSIELTALRFGQPAADELLPIAQTRGAGSPGIAFPPSVTTDNNGRAVVTFDASDPGLPRAPLDGQVFGFGGSWATQSDLLIEDVQSAIAVLVFSGFVPPAQPKWDDVRPIFEPYARVYPGMTEIIDLADFDAVVASKDVIKQRLLLSTDAAGFMPVSRDLSARKRDMIVAWIDAGCPR
jgi:hypothetical protein